MNNLFIAISDVHLNLKNINVSIKVLKQALDEAKQLNIPLIIAGDLNDTKAIMRSEWVEALIRLFKSYSDVTIHIIDGNHDKQNKFGSMSSLEFLDLIENVNVYHSLHNIKFNNIQFTLLPYQDKNSDFLDNIEVIRKNNIKNLICHQGFLGAYMGDYVVDESSVDPKELKDFDWVGSGHYHKHQYVEDNIVYFGSPFTVNFGESGHNKFIWKIYESDGKIYNQPIPTTARKHIQLVLEPGYQALEKPKELIESNKDDLFKIIMKGPKEFALSRPNIDVVNKTVVPEILRQSEVRISQDIISEPIKVIKQYLEDCITEFDKKQLEDYLWPIVNNTLNNNSSKINKNNRVKNIKAENFLSYKELQYNYSSKGLTLIEGHDEDNDISTGAGKSSFLDVVCYGLFGKTSKDLKADEVINRSSSNNLFVQVEIQTDKGLMVVNRYRKHKEHDNDLNFAYVGQSEPSRGKDLRETQKLLEDELGLNYDMFLRSSYFTQFGNIDRFLAASDTEKKKIISEICDTQIYDLMVEDIKIHLKSLISEQQTLEKKIIAKNSEYDTIFHSHADLKNNIKVWDDSQLEMIEDFKIKSKDWNINQEKEIFSLETKRDGFESDRKERLDLALKDQFDWEEQEKTNIRSINIDINNKNAQVKELRAQAIAPKKPDFDAQREAIKNKLDIVKKLEQELSKLNSEIYAKQVSIDKHKSDIQLAQSKETEINCISCYQPISKEHIDKQVQNLMQNMNVLTTDQVNLQAKYDQIKKTLEIKPELENKITQIACEEQQYNSDVQSIVGIKRQADSLEQDIIKIQEGLSNRPGNPNDFFIESINRDVNQYIDQVKNKKLEKNPFTDRITEEENKINPYSRLYTEATDRLSILGKEKNQLSSEQNNLQEKIDYTNWWKDALHVYIKSYLTDSFIEQINVLANEKLLQMFDGILSIHISAQSESKKSLKEKISVVIYNRNDECSYNSLSGGERCRICFALNLAIAKVTSINFGFLMFDEILNGLDEVGKAQVMKVLKELESEYETIFVIDHTTEFKSLFSNNILVTKKNGISEI